MKLNKTVILDGFALNPGDLDWTDFESLIPKCEIYDFTPQELILERSKNADALITNKTPLNAENLSKLPKLKYIGVLATGYNIIDVEAAKKRGIVVTNIPSYSTNSVAQTVFAHLLNITTQVGYHARQVREGRWTRNRDFCFWDKPLIEIHGLTMGIIGLGHIGMAVAEIARSFGMKVIAETSRKQEELPEFVRKVNREELFRESDVLSIHCPLNHDTRNLVNAERLSLMKPSTILINTSRGPIIDEEALAKALNEEKIYAAGLDVLSSEPPKENNPLLTAKNCYITPHYAWATEAARKRLMDIAVKNFKAFLEGKAMNDVTIST
ncbi:MAG: D-2-hydroxyacid dehydrogenase [Dysgonamonadaceae bacterium]|jgi:glycerate dehydrogenase|nr:D-2-hydroxyacid dehydrogenase [Dysgonamonadaceae bacterium]